MTSSGPAPSLPSPSLDPESAPCPGTGADPSPLPPLEGCSGLDGVEDEESGLDGEEEWGVEDEFPVFDPALPRFASVPLLAADGTLVRGSLTPDELDRAAAVARRSGFTQVVGVFVTPVSLHVVPVGDELFEDPWEEHWTVKHLPSGLRPDAHGPADAADVLEDFAAELETLHSAAWVLAGPVDGGNVWVVPGDAEPQPRPEPALERPAARADLPPRGEPLYWKYLFDGYADLLSLASGVRSLARSYRRAAAEGWVLVWSDSGYVEVGPAFPEPLSLEP